VLLVIPQNARVREVLAVLIVIWAEDCGRKDHLRYVADKLLTRTQNPLLAGP
jgi:hypothetical protein